MYHSIAHVHSMHKGGKILPPQASRSQEERAWSFSSAARANLRGDSVFHPHRWSPVWGSLIFSSGFVERNAAVLGPGPPALKCLLVAQVLFLPVLYVAEECYMFSLDHINAYPLCQSPLFFTWVPFFAYIKGLEMGRWKDLSPQTRKNTRPRQGVRQTVFVF